MWDSPSDPERSRKGKKGHPRDDSDNTKTDRAADGTMNHPEHPWRLSENDRRMLKAMKIDHENAPSANIRDTDKE